MKIKTTAALLLGLTINFVVLAQKPYRTARELPGRSPAIYTTIEPAQHLQPRRGSISPFRLNAETQKPGGRRSPDRRLKAEPASAGFAEKLDSLHALYYDTISKTFYNGDMEYYLYDTKGRNYSYWNTTFDVQLKVFVPQSKTDVKYSGDKVESETYSDWNASSGRWEPSYRDSYTYDANGYQVTDIYSYYDAFAVQWYPQDLDSTKYSPSGMLLEEISYGWDGIWYPNNRYLYTYDGNENLIQETNYYPSGDTLKPWTENYQTVHYLDRYGRDSITIQTYWDGFQWSNNDSTLFSYDANGNLLLQADYYWNGEIMVWDPGWKEEYAYDAGNRMISAIYYYSDYFNSTWYIVDKYEYTYDASGNVLEEAYSTYDTISKSYTPDYRDTYKYDLSKDIQSIAMPYWFGSEFEGEPGMQFNNKITDYKELTWSTARSVFDTTEIDLVFYSGFYDSPVNDAACNADFSWRLDILDDQLVYFTDKSDSTVVSFYWMFGDGATSTRRNPQHQYAKPGTYRVVLTTVDATGFCTNTNVQQIKVGNPLCTAAFSVLLDTGKLQVTLTNKSAGSGIQYYWNFGDGSVTDVKDPVHAYQYPGTYKITLTISSDLGACKDQYSAIMRAATDVCNADFAVFVDSLTNTGYFRAKQVLPGNQYQWTLGDGSSGNSPNFFHTFTNAGYYSAALIVSNSQAGCVESSRENLLIGKPATVGKADFIYLAGADNKVEFTNQSVGSGLSYYWDFNDGQNSTETNPVHPFVLPGYYTVCLTVFDASGNQDTHCEKIFAGTDTKDECQARFEYYLSSGGLHIQCWDRSFGEPDKYLWTYNGGAMTDVKDPWWNASAASYVRVRQTIMNSGNGCRDDAYALVNMGAEDRIKAGFAFEEDTSGKKADTYPVDFVGVSLGDAGKLKWSFGDGTYDSTTVNPTHVYSSPGLYNACLTVTNTSTGQSDTECHQVRLGWPVSDRDLTLDEAGLKVYPNPFSVSTRIEIALREASDIDLSVYDLMGRKVKTIAAERRSAGVHSFTLEASQLESGSYYLILETDYGREEQLINLIR